MAYIDHSSSIKMTLTPKISRCLTALTAVAAIIFVISSCGRSTADENIAAAKTSLTAGDYDGAARAIATFDSESALADASTRSLIDLAIICMELNEQRPEEGYDATALIYYQRARENDSDSVDLYMLNADREHVRYLATLLGLQRAMELDGNFPDEGEDAEGLFDENNIQPQ